jgi:hypothetical protein
MNNFRPIQFRGAEIRMNQQEMFYLAYPLEKYLLEYLTLGVIALNSRYNESWQESKPLTIIIGGKETLDSFMEVLEIGQQFDRCGDVAYLRHVTADELTEFVYEKLRFSNSPFVTIYGFERIKWSDDPARELEALSLLLCNLDRLQNQFVVPILLAGLTEIKNGDSRWLMPKFNSEWGEIKLVTDSSWSIDGPIGQLKLFRLDKSKLEELRIPC